MPQPDAPKGVPTPAPERRKPRRTAQLRGIIVLLDGSRKIECRIEDVSSAGTRLFVDDTESVPPHCYLLVTGKEVAYEARVVWTRANEHGLNFINTLPLEGLRNTKLQFLRSLKLELLRT